MVAKSDENYQSLASGIERIKRNSKYLSNREKQQRGTLTFHYEEC